jgi:predicted O-methyltransferase YrrM
LLNESSTMYQYESEKHEQITRQIEKEIGVTEKEGKFLAALAKNVPYLGVIVEIGSYHGRSAAYMAAAMKPGTSLFCVDHWQHRIDRQVFKDNLNALDLYKLVDPIQENSIIAAQQFMDPIDLLFIDGNHAYSYVKADFEAWYPKVRIGGVIAFHDYNNPICPDVERYIDEAIRYKLRSLHVCGRIWAGRK